ncbi:putative protein kinase (incomplete catalytic triad) [Neospora caninum Liverpool]|uniref:Uncharacterized protein n=1 Tax=Neospora caninum (strain Liverpool) TaxID=572307 RepID=F0VD01_NEOCL|nr:putative protein kinase (incomplete catalytic triad) [Neospora caninum Liverpool]CBZ51516.1 putative protein kinase (incomplete catalytic triad) [Neospora caninum Liverpool]|eukprot:XP_003881549.1 putative protein kinase (incomplete catalytic triad) [Neospora caninum Liverpool]
MSQSLRHSGAGNTLLFSPSCPVHSLNRTTSRDTAEGELHVLGADQRDDEASKLFWATKSNTTLLEHAQKIRHVPASSPSDFPIGDSLYAASSSPLPRLLPAQHRNPSLQLARPSHKSSEFLLGHEGGASFSYATIADDGKQSHPWKTIQTQNTESSPPFIAASAPFTIWREKREIHAEKEHNAGLCLCEVALSASTTAGTSESTQSSSVATPAEICSQPSLASLVKFAGRATRVEGRQRLYRNTSTVLGHGFSGDVKIFKHRHTEEVFALKTVLNEEGRMQRGWRLCSWRGRRPCPRSSPEERLRGEPQKATEKENAVPGKTHSNVGGAGNADPFGEPRGKTRGETDAAKTVKSQTRGTPKKDSRGPRGCGEVPRRKNPESQGPRKAPKASEEKDKDMRRDLQAIMGEGVYACLSADHPTIIKLVEFVEDDEGVHLIMPVCKGGPLSRASLRRFLTGSNPFGDATAGPGGKFNRTDRGDPAAPWQTEKTDEESWRSWERVAKKFTWQILKVPQEHKRVLRKG